MSVHTIKCWPEYFSAVASGEKPYELRKADRPYEDGDMLFIREFVPCPECLGTGRIILDPEDSEPCRACGDACGTFTGRTCERKVTHILAGPAFGLMEGWCILGLGRKGADMVRRRDHR